MVLATVLLAAVVAPACGPTMAQSDGSDSGDARTLGPDQMTGGSVEKGRRLARRHCARCHVIAAYNPHGGTGNAPSMDRLVTWDSGLWRISTFFDRPPHAAIVRMQGVPRPTDLPSAAHPFELTVAELEHIVAWARRLKAQAQ